MSPAVQSVDHHYTAIIVTNNFFLNISVAMRGLSVDGFAPTESTFPDLVRRHDPLVGDPEGAWVRRGNDPRRREEPDGRGGLLECADRHPTGGLALPAAAGSQMWVPLPLPLPRTRWARRSAPVPWLLQAPKCGPSSMARTSALPHWTSIRQAFPAEFLTSFLL